MMTKTKVLVIISLSTLTMLLSGCAVALVGAGIAAGAAGTRYVAGDLEVTMEERIDAVYRASLESLDQLGLPIISQEKNALEAKIVSRTVSDKKVEIVLKRTETDMTRVSIRIGTFGDKTQSRAIHHRIRENL